MESRPVASTGTCSSRPRMPACSALVRDLNRLYRATPALHELDCDAAGFEWIVADDAGQQRLRLAAQGPRPTERGAWSLSISRRKCLPRLPRPRAVRRPLARSAQLRLPRIYGGSNVGNAGAVDAVATRDSPELHLVVPPLAAIFLVPGRLSDAHLRPGRPHPLGATWDGRGVNFALFSAQCREGRALPVRRQGRRETRAHRAAGAHRRRLARLSAATSRPGSSTAIACTAPTSPSAGHRFNPNKLLLDPYAKRLAGRLRLERRAFRLSHRQHARGPVLRPARQCARHAQVPSWSTTAFTWGERTPPARPVGRHHHLRSARQGPDADARRRAAEPARHLRGLADRRR